MQLADRPPLMLSRRLRSVGETTHPLERGVDEGRFVRVRPGAYLTTAEWAGLDARMRHVVAMDALLITSTRGVVFARESAAAVLGLPLLGAWPTAPRVVEDPASTRRNRVGTVAHRTHLDPGDVVRVAGFDVTSPVRSALDLAAWRPFADGVAVFDHVLRAEAVAKSDLDERIESRRPFRYARKVSAALACATGLAESPLESLSLARFRELGFPPPDQQVDFDTGGGRFRADFYWPEFDVVGEADGRKKYVDREALIAEKERENELRAVTRGFVRWEWSHAWDAEPLAARLERAGIRRLRRNAPTSIRIDADLGAKRRK